MAQQSHYIFDEAQGKSYEKFHRWNCGVELRQNEFGTYTRVQAGFYSIFYDKVLQIYQNNNAKEP